MDREGPNAASIRKVDPSAAVFGCQVDEKRVGEPQSTIFDAMLFGRGGECRHIQPVAITVEVKWCGLRGSHKRSHPEQEYYCEAWCFNPVHVDVVFMIRI